MNRVERERQLRWLMSMRVVTVTTLLICAFGIELLLRPSVTLRPLFLLAAATYALVLLYAFVDRWLKSAHRFFLLQLVGDTLMITFFVQITGGIDSPMTFLYLLPITVASMRLYRRGGLALAGVCWMLYSWLLAFGAEWTPFGSLVPLSRESDAGRVVYLLVAHLVAMLAVAVLSSYLSERLRAQGQELVERQRAVARLKALNENIIESINSGLVTTDLTGRINFLNRGGAEIIGLAQQAVEGRTVEELFELEDGYLREIRRQLLEKRRFRFERYFETGDAHWIFLGIAASNLHDRAGKPLGYIFIFQDLTDIHALEQEVRLKERMVALGQMAAGMAHELRNPLAAISGSVQYLKGQLKPRGETLELMDIILRESQRLDQAIRDFLTFARPGTFAPERSDLVELLESNLKLLRRSREFRPRHRIETHYAAKTIDCEIDPNRMKQVFWNLATNALKAMPDGGTLSIAVELVDAGRGLAISFADDGVGMSPREQERYFQPFASHFNEGTGLGAAIVYRLVQEHGGKIQMESTEGAGTCVRIRLPRAQAALEVDEGFELTAVGGAGR